MRIGLRISSETGGAPGDNAGPSLPGDTVATPDGELLTTAPATGLLAINPVELSGQYAKAGGTCGFGGFSGSFQIFQHESYSVIPGEGNDFGVEGLSLTPSDLPPGGVGFYDGTLNADGTGTIMSFHVETGCVHAWEVTFSNPRPLNLPFPPVQVP